MRTGLVKEVDKANCTVVLIDDADDIEWHGVRLRSQENESDLGFLVFPKVNSSVVFGQLSENVAVVLMCSEVEEVQIKSNDFIFTLNKDGLKLLGDSDNVVTAKKLKTELDKVIDFVGALVNAFNTHLHPTPAGPSSPPTVPFNQNLTKPNADAFGNPKIKTS